jgi:spermidine/putrescine transport system permease protein
MPINNSRISASDSRGFWSWLSSNQSYHSVSLFLIGTHRKRFIFLAAVPLLWALVANFAPLLKMLEISFYEAYPLSKGREIVYTLDNWVEFFLLNVYTIPFLRSIVFSIILTISTLILTYPIAYFLAQHLPKSKQLLYLLILLIPFWVGEIIRTYAIMILLGNRGLINLILQFFGLIEKPIPFMYTYFSLGIGIVYLTSLYMLLPLYSILEQIPKNLLEASADLGAGPWTRFWRVTLPLSKDGIASGCTLVFLISMGFYAAPVMLGGPSSTMFSETIAGHFNVAADRWPVGAAFSSIMLISTLVIAATFLKIMGRGGKGIIR